MPDSRNQILENIRSLSSPRIDTRGVESGDLSSLFPSTRIDVENLLKRFEGELSQISGEVKIVKSSDEILTALTDFIREGKYQSAVLSNHPLLKEIKLSEQLTARLPECSISISAMYQDRTVLREQLAVTDVGITGADFLIADTGTIAMLSSPDEGRLVSLLPPTHVVVATAKQLVPTLSAVMSALEEKYGNSFPNACLTFITGPSRTADIEKQLVLGVHGPKRLIVLVLT